MFTLRQMLSATPLKNKAKASQQCYGQSYPMHQKYRNKQTTMKQSGGYIVDDKGQKYREFLLRVRCTDAFRKVAIRFYGPVAVGTECWAWCDCPYFKFTCEVALAKGGSSSVVQSDGQKPRLRNPQMRPLLCKHCVLAFALAIRAQKREPQADIKAWKAPSKTNTPETVKSVPTTSSGEE